MIDTNKFPQGLQQHINNYTVEDIIQGRIGDKIIQLVNHENKSLYLKLSETESTQIDMMHETKLLNWLTIKEINAPKVLYYLVGKHISYMLISNITGKNAHLAVGELSIEAILNITAIALKKIHEIDYTNIPLEYKDSLQDEIDAIREDVVKDRIDIKAFMRANNSQTPQEALDYLVDRKSMFTKDVFTHGDYCLPNILIEDKDNYGFIDWAQAGVGDIYRDIAPMFKSIQRNFGEEYSELFCQYYGITKEAIDHEKISYYYLIDQFYYCKKKSK